MSPAKKKPKAIEYTVALTAAEREHIRDLVEWSASRTTEECAVCARVLKRMKAARRRP